MGLVFQPKWIAEHPFRIDFEDGSHARFKTFVCAAATAIHEKKQVVQVFDEWSRRIIPQADCAEACEHWGIFKSPRAFSDAKYQSSHIRVETPLDSTEGQK